MAFDEMAEPTAPQQLRMAALESALNYTAWMTSLFEEDEATPRKVLDVATEFEIYLREGL